MFRLKKKLTLIKWIKANAKILIASYVRFLYRIALNETEARILGWFISEIVKSDVF